MASTLLTFVYLTGVSIALAAVWSYDKNAANGPNNWPGTCATGMKQSPIDINTTTAMYDSNLGNFTLVNYDTTPAGVNFTAKNDGTTLKISFDSDVYNVSGGGLTGTYTTVQFHLHWGSNNSQGSEHTMDGMMYPAEIHFVSYNTKYYDLSTSLPHDDGLAVLGVMLKVGPNDNPYYKLFLDRISDVMYKGNSTTFSAFKLMDLLPADTTKYFRYPGSLTTPACSEAVTWTVFKDPVMISEAQLGMLRSMMYNNSVNIVDNYRPVQMLHSRQVKVSFNMSATTTAPPVTMISPSVTTTAPPDTTAAAPDTTTAPPDTTTAPPDTTTAPPDTTTAPPDTTDGVALKISNVLLLMFLLGVAFFY